MYFRRTVIFCFAIALVVAGLISPVTISSASKKLLAVGSTQTSSSHYAYFVAFAKVINTKVPEVGLSVVETGATVDNINRMKKGELDMGMLTMHTNYEIYHGLGAWQGKPNTDQYMLWVYALAPSNYIVRQDSGVKTVSDLDGRSFNPGMRGSASEKTTEACLDALGIKPKYYRGGTDDTLSGIKDNRLVGYVKSGAGFIIDASSMDLATFVPIRILGFSDQDIAKVQAKYPHFGSISVPKGMFKDSPAYKTFVLVNGVIAKKDLSEDLAYKMVKAVCENVDDQAAAFPSLKGMNIAQLTMEHTSIPLHPGAVRYYKEIGMKIPANLIPK
jgi:TRAP transporter TAXI family solute receptor